MAAGTRFNNAEVEPYLSVNPLNPDILVGVWQQDRWSNGSARGLLSATSLDGGQTWTRQPLPFSRCAGGNAGNGGDYERATDPWVSYAPDGVAHAMGLSTSGGSFQPGSTNAMLASRSLDHGRTWSAPATLIRDGAGFFNDKNTITADPTNASRVYAVWDRLVAGDNGGPTYFARSLDGGVQWEPARAIYDPGPTSQTLGNVIVVLPSGILVNLFTQIDSVNNVARAGLAVIRSFDQGVNWSAPRAIAELLAVGARDPQTNAAVRDGSVLAQIAVAPNGDLFVVWQDARFNNGARDAIAMARSIDGGVNWTTPTRVNSVPGVAAFTPTVHVRSDGVVGVSYYDFRSDTPAAPLSTDYWLASSADAGATWTERRIAAAFNLAIAPNAGGYFLGDYQALASRGGVFVPFFVKTNGADLGNRTDVFAAPAVAVAAAVASSTGVDSTEMQARHESPAFQVTPEIEGRVSANLRQVRARRLRQWEDVQGPPAR